MPDLFENLIFDNSDSVRLILSHLTIGELNNLLYVYLYLRYILRSDLAYLSDTTTSDNMVSMMDLLNMYRLLLDTHERHNMEIFKSIFNDLNILRERELYNNISVIIKRLNSLNYNDEIRYLLQRHKELVIRNHTELQIFSKRILLIGINREVCEEVYGIDNLRLFTKDYRTTQTPSKKLLV